MQDSKRPRHLKASRIPSILLLGAPGSGKTALGNMLRRYKDFSYVNVGHILRDRKMEVRKTPKKMQPCVELADKDFIADLSVEKMTSQVFRGRQFLLQGFPRDIAQYMHFQHEVGDIQLAFLLEISDECARQRLSRRRLYGARWDDAPDLIPDRLEVFHQYTEPLAEHLENLGKLTRIDGFRSPEHIFHQVLGVVEKHFGK